MSFKEFLGIVRRLSKARRGPAFIMTFKRLLAHTAAGFAMLALVTYVPWVSLALPQWLG